MFKRARWMGLGAVMGVGGSVWAQVRLRRAAQRYLPSAARKRAVARARAIGRDLGGAAAEGRQAMQERELELRARLEVPPAPPVAEAPALAATVADQLGPPLRPALTAVTPPTADPGPGAEPAGGPLVDGRGRSRRSSRRR